jgi:GMP synthase (glutamine-hydrolysing)
LSFEREGVSPRLIVVQPDPADPLFELAGWFEEAGISWTYIRPFEGEPIPDRLDADGLVVLGGYMSSLDDADHTWLEDVRALQRNAAEMGRPSLGICLGSQLMAQAFGGETSVGDRGLETGVVRVDWLEAAADDELVADLPSPFLAGTMHGDMIVTLPPGAVWLGSGEVYRHQAFRFGDTSWGVQFHPELNRGGYQMWVDSQHDASCDHQQRLREGGQDLLRDEKEVLRSNRALAGRFAALVHARDPVSADGSAW